MLKYLLAIGLLLSSNAWATQQQEVAATLDQFHQAASQANLTQYFNLLTDDAIFMGTDVTERWTKVQFKQYVAPLFKQGKGWSYQAKQRNLHKINSNTYVFDEVLINKKYGECRSSGVMVNHGNGWKIAQYNLSVPLPNAIASQLIQQIQQHKQTLAANDH